MPLMTLLLVGTIGQTPLSLADIRDFVNDKIANDKTIYTAPSTKVRTLPNGETELAFHPGGLSGQVSFTNGKTPQEKAMDFVIREQFDISLIRRFRVEQAKANDWIPVLEFCEEDLEQFLEESRHATEGDISEMMQNTKTRIWKRKSDFVDQAAKTNGNDRGTIVIAVLSERITIKVRSEPKALHLQHIAPGKLELFELATRRNRQGVSPPEWKSTTEGESISFPGGNYYFRASWEKNPSQWVMSDKIKVENDIEVVVTPDSIRAFK